MEKINEFPIIVIGGMLNVEISIDVDHYVGRISGYLVPLASIMEPGDPTPIMNDKDYGPVDVTAETEPELMATIRKRIEEDVGKIIKFGNDN